MAKIQYEKDDKGATRVKITPPEAPLVVPQKPWVPVAGEDTRDLRDPGKLGRRILAAVKRRKK